MASTTNEKDSTEALITTGEDGIFQGKTYHKLNGSGKIEIHFDTKTINFIVLPYRKSYALKNTTNLDHHHHNHQNPSTRSSYNQQKFTLSWSCITMIRTTGWRDIEFRCLNAPSNIRYNGGANDSGQTDQIQSIFKLKPTRARGQSSFRIHMHSGANRKLLLQAWLDCDCIRKLRKRYFFGLWHRTVAYVPVNRCLVDELKNRFSSTSPSSEPTTEPAA